MGISTFWYYFDMVRSLSFLQSCSLCAAAARVPAGSEDEYELVLPSQAPEAVKRGNATRVVGRPPCYPVCEDCVTRLMGPRVSGRTANPTGVADALRERHGLGYVTWASPWALPELLDQAAEYLRSREAREGVGFGTWIKMQELLS